MSDQEDSTHEKSILSSLKQHFDELRVQMALGKADATDYLEEQKEKFAGHLESAKERVEKSPLIDNDLTRSIKSKIDALKVQLALGKMESKEVYREQKEKIGEAITALRETTAPLRGSAAGAFAEVSDVVGSGADYFKAKLSALGVNLGSDEEGPDEDDNKEESAVEAKADPSAERAALEKELQDLSVKADEATTLAGSELESATDQLKAAYEEVTRKLDLLLK